MKFGQLLMRFCRSQTVAVGLSVTTATLMIVALLSPANAQFWGDSLGVGWTAAATPTAPPRAAVLAPKGCHGQDCGDGRCKCRLARLRA